MKSYKNSWTQGWTSKASKEPNPPAQAARPAARGVSSPFLQDILQRFLPEICTEGGGTPGRIQMLPHPGRILAAFWPHSAASQPFWRSLFGFQSGSRKYLQKNI